MPQPDAESTYRRLALDQSMPFQFGRYVTIGVIVAAIDLGSFKALLMDGVGLGIAITVAYAIALGAHFALNKYANFRAHDRPIHHQAATYAVVTLTGWLVTMLVVEVGVHRFGLMPLVAKVISVVVVLPIGFFGNRVFTFGPGVAALVARIGGRR